MRSRRTLGVAVALGILSVPALASAAIPTTIRIEGGSANLIPEVPVSVDDTPGATVTVNGTDSADPTVPASTSVAAGSVTAQTVIAGRQYGLPLGFTIYPFGTFLTQVGPDTMPASYSPSWRLTVNGRSSQAGADATVLQPNDSVVWAFTSNFNARELHLTVSGDRFRQGQAFTATVTSTDPSTPTSQPLVAAPAAGAVVTYGGQTATADANGQVTFNAVGEGVQPVGATRSDEVRSPARSVCSYTTDPGVCDLPAVTPPTTPNANDADNVAPGSRIRSVVQGRKYTRINQIQGTAGPDRSDVRRVEVAIARRIGTRCRYLNTRGVFGNARACNRPVFLIARSSGTNWLIGRKAPFVPGRYLAMSRAIDGAGNRETQTLSRINTVSFTVVPAVRRAKATTATTTKAQGR